MALQMATNITPDAFAGVGGAVFDATDGLSVTWQVNGTPYLVAYQITIHALDDDSTELYSTGKITLASPFYGVLASGEVQMFAAETISAAALSDANISNGNEYKMYITQWWGSTDQQSVTNQSASVIRALSAPELSIDEYDAPITQRMYSFTATYSQSEGDEIAWVRWILYDQSNSDNVLVDTGEIYGTSQLQFSYDAFFSGTIYGIEIIVETQSGQRASSGVQDVYISYASGEATGTLVAMQKCGWNGVDVSWASAQSMLGTAFGDYSFTESNELVLPSGSSVSWETESGEPISFEAPFSIVWAGLLGGGADAFPFSASTENGEVSVQVSGDNSSTTVNFLFNATSVASITLPVPVLGTTTMLYVLATPDNLYATADDGNGTVTSGSAAIGAEQSNLTSIRLAGQQTCKALWIEKGTIEGPISPANFSPSYTTSTCFLTAFENNDLNAGNTDTTGYSLYRLDNETGEYAKVANLDVTQTGLIDYSAKNGHSYMYQLWYMSDTIFTRQPFSSNEITPCRWNVLLIAAEQDESGVYHPRNVYAFGANITLGDESNNSKNTTQDTFAGYPAFQQSSNAYRSGKLSALIGKIDPYTNQYIGDTSDYADEIMGLSTTNMALFLRDRKGGFRFVKVKGAITQKVNPKWPNQASTISIPWVEVGDASKMQLVLTSSDPLWPYDEVADTTLFVDTETGHLLWRIADGYLDNGRGSILAVNGAGHMTQTYDGTAVEMANMHIDNRMHVISDQ